MMQCLSVVMQNRRSDVDNGTAISCLGWRPDNDVTVAASCDKTSNYQTQTSHLCLFRLSTMLSGTIGD